MRAKYVAGIFVLAFVVRLIFVVQWHATPYGPTPLLDALIYHQWAQNIALGHISHGRAFYMMPLYPYVLGLLYFIFGHSLWTASLFNALIDAASCAILADLAFVAFGQRAALVTGILAALYRPFIFYTAPVMKESLGLFLLALFLHVSYHALQLKDLRKFFWSGICLGLCTLVRGNVLALAVVIIGFVFREGGPPRWRKSGALLFGIAAILLPLTLHNALTSGDFVLTSYADGFNAYIGHGPSATGNSYAFPPDITSNPGTEEFDVTRIAVQARGKPLKPSEVNAYWWEQTIDYALAHPSHELSLLKNEFEAFWSNDEPYDNYDMGFIARHFGTILSWPLAGFGFITGLAVFTVIAATGRQRSAIPFFAAMLLVYMLTLVPFYVTDRYRLPAAIFLLPLAGTAIPVALEQYRKKFSAKILAASFAALVPLVLALWPGEVNPLDEAFDWGTLCTVYEDEGYHIAALLALNQALAASPHTVGTDAWIKATDAMDHLGRHKESEQTLQDVAKMYPQDGTVPYNIGRMAFIDEDYPAAFLAFQKAIELAPTFALSYRGLAAVYDHYGYRAKALDAIRRGLAVVPDDPKLLEVLQEFR